jgi:hypothetical protein
MRSGGYGSPYRRGSSGAGYYGSGGSAGPLGLGELLRRIVDWRQMDFEAAFEDITMLCSSNPQRMYVVWMVRVGGEGGALVFVEGYRRHHHRTIERRSIPFDSAPFESMR